MMAQQLVFQITALVLLFVSVHHVGAQTIQRTVFLVANESRRIACHPLADTVDLTWFAVTPAGPVELTEDISQRIYVIRHLPSLSKTLIISRAVPLSLPPAGDFGARYECVLNNQVSPRRVYSYHFQPVIPNGPTRNVTVRLIRLNFSAGVEVTWLAPSKQDVKRSYASSTLKSLRLNSISVASCGVVALPDFAPMSFPKYQINIRSAKNATVDCGAYLGQTWLSNTTRLVIPTNLRTDNITQECDYDIQVLAFPVASNLRDEFSSFNLLDLARGVHVHIFEVQQTSPKLALKYYSKGERCVTRNPDCDTNFGDGEGDFENVTATINFECITRSDTTNMPVFFIYLSCGRQVGPDRIVRVRYTINNLLLAQVDVIIFNMQLSSHFVTQSQISGNRIISSHTQLLSRSRLINVTTTSRKSKSVSCDIVTNATPTSTAPESSSPPSNGNGEEFNDIDECANATDTCSPFAVCNNTMGEFNCSCLDSFEDVDECANGTDTCSPVAVCNNTMGGFNCSCLEGFEGDGFNCTDVDECANGTDTCSPFAVCNNTMGGFNCSCIDGYNGDGFNCIDIDECANATDTCSPFAVCNNTMGDFNCTCTDGYSGDGFNCTDVDECANRTDTCSPFAVCNNTMGDFNCTCRRGYNGDGFNCTDNNECDTITITCPVSTICLNTIGSFNCPCAPGYTGIGTNCTVTALTAQDGAKSPMTILIATVASGVVVLIIVILLTVIVCKRNQRSHSRRSSSTRRTIQSTENAAYGKSSLQPTAPSAGVAENGAYGMGGETEHDYSYAINPMAAS